MSVQTLIDRTTLGANTTITIAQFIAATIDYRPLGDMGTQLAQMSLDYDSVGWRSMHSGQRLQVDLAYWDYLELIRSNYTHEPSPLWPYDGAN